MSMITSTDNIHQKKLQAVWRSIGWSLEDALQTPTGKWNRRIVT